MSYWVYESWVAENKAVVHSSSCGFCNNGAGRGTNIHGDRNGRWTGPFGTLSDAACAAEATGRPTRQHRCVATSPVATSSPTLSESGGAPATGEPPAVQAADLEKYGFTPAGRWSLDPARKGGVRVTLDRLQNERVVYAFIVGSSVMYVGVCDSPTTTLKVRMARYESLIGAGTNARIVGEIKECLAKGLAVTIVALRPDAATKYIDLDVDHVRGLESALIERFRPGWNRRR